MKRPVALVLAACLVAAVFSVGAFADDWVRLGTRKVSLRADHDVIPVTAEEGAFRALRLKVEGVGIKIIDVKIHLGNGDVKDIAVKKFFRAGSLTRAFDLPGERRIVKKVEFVYKTKGRRPGRATVHLLGLRADS